MIRPGFFLGARIEDICIGNMHSFLAWAMHSSTYESLSSEDRDGIHSTAIRIATLCNVTFAEGFNDKVDHIKMTLNPIAYIHRPLIVYLGSFAKNAIGDMIFMYYGFSRKRFRKCNYWYRKGYDKVQPPMLFFHGISTGWLFYLPLSIRYPVLMPLYIMRQEFFHLLV